jgi:hypothetical protein
MLIRSQNKEVLATLELLFDVEVSGGVISARRDMSWCCLLGEYSTKAKAMKVLDMIQEAYSEYQIMLNFSVSYLHEFKEKTDGFTIFQMPEDSEVEA